MQQIKRRCPRCMVELDIGSHPFCNRFNISREVTTILAELRFTPQQLGEAIGVSRQAVTDWKNRRRVPSMENVGKMRNLIHDHQRS